ncbi:MAG: ABC transporter permease [Pseudomonadota bacterium]
MELDPLQQRRWENFKSNKRGYWSFWIFLVLFVLSLFAEVIANDKPLVVSYDGSFLSPVFVSYPETRFGGDFETEADYTDPFVQELIEEKGGWMIWPLVPWSHDTINYEAATLPAPPSADNWLGTDDRGRDLLALIIYGFRISVTFGLIVTAVSTVVGVLAGAAQGYFGGWVDLFFQRIVEIWSSTPTLYVIMIISAVLTPNFWILMALVSLFSWTGLVGVVRAEFLRARNFEYVQAARALGVSNWKIMVRHLLPNAMVATLTMLPFVLTATISLLATLDFLGFGLSDNYPSLGEIGLQGKNNLQAPWLGLTAFFTFAVMLSLLVFVFEAVRDAFDPRKTFN